MGVLPAHHVPRPAILAKQGHPCTLCITSNRLSRTARAQGCVSGVGVTTVTQNGTEQNGA